MNFLNIALRNASRGFRVFPLVPKTKRPLPLSEGDHFDAATVDPEQIQAWAAQEPSANVGLCPDENFCFLETDDEASFREKCADLPPEIWDTMRVSARENRCYYVFRQTMRTRKAGNMTVEQPGKPNLYEFKQHRVYVVGPGSIHEKTGTPYEIRERNVPAMPDILLRRLCELYGAPEVATPASKGDETKRETDLLDRFLGYYEVATVGDWFNKGKQWFRPIVCPWSDSHENSNEGTSTCLVYTEGGGYGFDCKHRCANKGWKEFRAELELRSSKPKFHFAEPDGLPAVLSPEPPEKPLDWRSHYHSFKEMENAPPAAFLIEAFLQQDAITALAAPVAQRKSLISLNVAHALCTREPLFDYFKVSHPPSRVLYLCPEMGLRSFTDRVKKIGLMPYVGATFFCRTMSADGTLELAALTADELSGAAVIIDTAVRYLKGDENSSEHMRVFAEDVFRLMREGATSVLLLHHSAKGTKESAELTLENAMRGSGELGAFVSTCWATRLQHPDEPYRSASFLANVKQRDFESLPFEVTSGTDCRLHIVDKPGDTVRLNSKSVGAPTDVDGKEGTALQVIQDNPGHSIRELTLMLKELGIKRSKSWVGNKRHELLGQGVKTAITVSTTLR